MLRALAVLDGRAGDFRLNIDAAYKCPEDSGLVLDAHGNMEYPQDPTPLTRAETPTVRLMDRGPSVRRLQERLNDHGAGLAADGIFGVMTREAVVRFQKDNQLEPDGIAGPLTWTALGE